MASRVFIATGDLLFRSKLIGAAVAGGGDVTGDDSACDIAVVELDGPAALERIADLVARRIPVLAYGSHVRADLLRAARDAGARAVPNSQVQETLKALLNA